MAWNHYYINVNRLYDPGEGKEDPYVFYELKIPPHGGIREEWTTIGMEHGASKICFVEYRKEDDDPDGVREAYGMRAESVYTFTVHAEEADPEKLFVYALYKDGSLHTGFDIDTENARAILVFSKPQSITAQQMLDIAQQAENAPRVAGAVEQIVKKEVLSDREDVLGLAYFRR